MNSYLVIDDDRLTRQALTWLIETEGKPEWAGLSNWISQEGLTKLDSGCPTVQELISNSNRHPIPCTT